MCADNQRLSLYSFLFPFTQQVRFRRLWHFPTDSALSLLIQSRHHGCLAGCYSRRMACDWPTVSWIRPYSPESSHRTLNAFWLTLEPARKLSLRFFLSPDVADRSSSDCQAKHSPFPHDDVLAENLLVRARDGCNIQSR